eukprot:scaffold27981_cov37-Cyclotella_meneghiniana.AAC.4
MLQSASNVTLVSEGDAIAVAIDLRLQFSADTTKHLGSNRCTKLQIPLHSMLLPETALFALTSLANQEQFSSQSWYNSYSYHDSFRLIIFESTRHSRDLPVSIAATEKLTLFVGHLTEDYDMASKFASLSTTDNDPSQSGKTGGQFYGLARSLVLLVAWHPLLHLFGEWLDILDVLHFGKDFLLVLLQACSLVVAKDMPQFALVHMRVFARLTLRC